MKTITITAKQIKLQEPTESARNAATRLIHNARRAGCVTAADLAAWMKARQLIRGGVL